MQREGGDYGSSKAVNRGQAGTLAQAELITLISSLIAYIKPVVSGAEATVRVYWI